MATVLRRPGSRFWWAYWRNPEGKLRGRSTKQTSRANALRVALEWSRIDRDLRQGRIAARQAQKVVADLVREIGAEVSDVPTVREWLTGWLQERQGHISDATERNYDKAIRDLLRFLGKSADNLLPSLDTRALQSWANDLGKRGLASGTVQNYFDPIKAASTKAWKRGLVPSDIAADLDLPKLVNAERDAMTQAEIDAILAVADPEWKTVILAGAYAGLRISDASSLTWEQVDLAAGVIRLTQRKTSKGILVPIHPRFRAHLETVPRTEGSNVLCPTLHGLTSRGSHGLSGKFLELMKRAGVQGENRGVGTRRFLSKSAHSLRHTFIRRLLAAGVDENVRMRLAGHVSKSAHKVYAVAEVDQLRRAIEALP